MIVGRDVSVLDQAGVARAAIESLAENFSDGIVAPIVLDRGRGPARRRRLQGGEHGPFDDRPPQRPLSRFRLGRRAFDDLVNLPASRLAARG